MAEESRQDKFSQENIFGSVSSGQSDVKETRQKDRPLT
jgi:hypothetical protein